MTTVYTCINDPEVVVAGARDKGIIITRAGAGILIGMANHYREEIGEAPFFEQFSDEITILKSSDGHLSSMYVWNMNHRDVRRCLKECRDRDSALVFLGLYCSTGRAHGIFNGPFCQKLKMVIGEDYVRHFRALAKFSTNAYKSLRRAIEDGGGLVQHPIATSADVAHTEALYTKRVMPPPLKRDLITDPAELESLFLK